MKKYRVLFFLLVFIYIVSCCFYTSAAQDIFYYQYDNPVFEKARALQIDRREDIRYMKYIVQSRMEQEEIDESKIFPDYSKIYCEYDWSPLKAFSFLKAEDKTSFLKAMTPKNYCFFLYYDDKLITTDLPYYEPHKETYGIEITGRAGMEFYQNYLNKEFLRQTIIDEGFEGYEPIYVINLQGLWFSIVEKNETEYLLYLPSAQESIDLFDEAIVPYQHLYDKKLMTVEEAEPLLKLLDDRFSGKLEVEETNINGGAVTSQNNQSSYDTISKEQQSTDANKDMKPTNLSYLWLIGAAVILVGGIVTVILVKKKRV